MRSRRRREPGGLRLSVEGVRGGDSSGGGRGGYFGADPAQLGVGDEVSPGLSHVCSELLECPPDDAGCDIFDCFTDYVVPAADSECLVRVR